MNESKLEKVTDKIGGTSEEIVETYAGMTVEEINETLIYMFGTEGSDIEFAKLIESAVN